MTVKPNLAARLARWLARSAHAPLRGWRVVAFVALVLVTGACAVWAVAERYRAAGRVPDSLGELSDFLYAPFLYLVPQSVLADVAALSLPQAIARLTGPLIPVLGLFWLQRERLLAWAARQIAGRWMRGHAVIFGEQGSADPLACASSTAGEVVVLVDPAFAEDEDRLRTLGAQGVIGLAALPASLGGASAVVVWQHADTDNIATAADIRAHHRLAAEEIDLLVGSGDLQAGLLQSPDLMLDQSIRLRPHAPPATAMRAALAGPQLPELALGLGQERVTLCLWGQSEALVWAARIALQQFWTVRLGAPRIVWAGESGDEALPVSLAGLVRHAEAVFGAGPQRPAVEIAAADDACLAADVTCHLVDFGTDDATLSRAFTLAAQLRQHHERPPPVQAVLDTGRAIAPLFASDKLVFLPPIIPGAGLTVSALRRREADCRAAEIHLAYDRQFGGGGTAPASGRWQDLAETYIAANRAAADHHAIKQWDAATSGLEGEALVEALARAEHNRWSAERLLAGWAPSGEGARDNTRRLHPDLRPWAALSEDAREKDRGAVRS